jgi:ribosomal protein L37AE/L43A
MALSQEEIRQVMSEKHVTVECLCGYIATFEALEWTCPECGRKWMVGNKREIMQVGLPTNKADMVEGFDNSEPPVERGA